jgi:WD40 repeat protein
MATLEGHSGAVVSVVFSPDGARIATNGIALWDVSTGQRLATLTKFASDCVEFSPDGTLLAAGGMLDGAVKLWHTVSGKEVATLKGPRAGAVSISPPVSIAFSPDGRCIAASADETVKIWDVSELQEVASLKGHTGKVRRVRFSPDGLQLASASDDGSVKIWNVPSQETAPEKGMSFPSVAFSPDGTRMASYGAAKVRFWDAITVQEIAVHKGDIETTGWVALDPEGARIAKGGSTGTITISNLSTGNIVATLKGHTGSIRRVALSPDGARAASAGRDGTVRVWDVPSGRTIVTLQGIPQVVRVIAFSPDGERLAWDYIPSVVKIWDIDGRNEVATLRGHKSFVDFVAFSRDGLRIASASRDETVKLWDAVSGKEIATLKGHAGGVRSVAFSPDGTRVVSGSADRTVKLWDMASGNEMITLKGHAAEIEGVAFSPDGTRIVSASRDGAVKLWDARPMTPDVKAEIEAVAHLKQLFSKPLSTSDVRAVIERDNVCGEAARQKALALIDRFRDETDPQTYCDAAWPVVRHPYSNVFVLRFALAQMKAARERGPENAAYRIGLGVAQYRLGKFQKERYADALATLRECDPTHPTTLAFLAMTQHRLDQKDEAQATLARLRELIKESQWADDQQAQAFLREATELIEGKAAKPQP